MKIFIFYFCLFAVFFLFSRKQGEKFNYKIILIIPAVLAFLLFLLSVVKIYFIYKLAILLAMIGLSLLTYWQWGKQIRRWFNG